MIKALIKAIGTSIDLFTRSSARGMFTGEGLQQECLGTKKNLTLGLVLTPWSFMLKSSSMTVGKSLDFQLGH